MYSFPGPRDDDGEEDGEGEPIFLVTGLDADLTIVAFSLSPPLSKLPSVLKFYCA